MADDPRQQLRYRHVVETIESTPWAILPETLEQICAIVSRRAAGIRLSEDEIREAVGPSEARREPFNRVSDQGGGAVAVLPLYGVILPRANMITQYSGGTALSEWRNSFRQALADPGVGAILIDVHSPGGSCALVPETAAEILAARGEKPIWAIANTLCASAAYHIASQADRLIASPSALVGSIGVFAVHDNLQGALEQAGVDRTFIYAGRFKVDGNDSEPLSETAHAAFQQMVDDSYDLFVADVAAGRGVKQDVVRNGFGEGRVLSAQAAAREGMVDAVGSFESTVAELMQPAAPAGRSGSRAEAPVEIHLDAEALAESIASRLQAPSAATDEPEPDDVGSMAESLRQTSLTLTERKTETNG